jgi:hypothetical protein
LPALVPFSLVINIVSFSAVAIEARSGGCLLVISGEPRLSLRGVFLRCGGFPFIIRAGPPFAPTIRAAEEFLASLKSIFVTAGAFIGPKLFLFLSRTRRDYGDYKKKKKEHGESRSI